LKGQGHIYENLSVKRAGKTKNSAPPVVGARSAPLRRGALQGDETMLQLSRFLPSASR